MTRAREKQMQTTRFSLIVSREIFISAQRLRIAIPVRASNFCNTVALVVDGAFIKCRAHSLLLIRRWDGRRGTWTLTDESLLCLQSRSRAAVRIFVFWRLAFANRYRESALIRAQRDQKRYQIPIAIVWVCIVLLLLNNIRKHYVVLQPALLRAAICAADQSRPVAKPRPITQNSDWCAARLRNFFFIFIYYYFFF